MSFEDKQIWLQVKERLKNELDVDSYENYFSSINEVYKTNDNIYFLKVKNNFIKTRIESGYLKRMNDILLDLLNSPHYFMIKTEKEIDYEQERMVETSSKNNFTRTSSCGLNPTYTFGNFVVGDSNRMAHRYATQVSNNINNLSSQQNLVYFFGDVGVGKTHLIEAIGNHILEVNPDTRVLYIRTQDFIEQYAKCGIGASSQQNYTDFYEKFNNLDVLLVDDIQLIEHKDKTQLEFFKIFENLYSKGKLIAITSDKKPKDLQNIMTRLTSRFEMALILDVSSPDRLHRINILKSKLKQELDEQNKINEFPEETLEYIATVCESNVRELEGALKRVLFYCDAFNHDFSIESAKEALQNILNFKNAANSMGNTDQEIKKLINVVSDYFKVGENDILSNSRKKELVVARRLCWYILRSKYDFSYSKIGEIFGGKDHSTVMTGVQEIENSLKEDVATKKNVENILKKIGKDTNII